MRIPKPAGNSLASISVTPDPLTIVTFAQVQFTALGTYTDSTIQNITSMVVWSSTDEAVVTLTNGSNGGKASGGLDGVVNVSASFGGIVSDDSEVTVSLPDAVTPPAQLFLIGSATPGGWANPVSTPSQQFSAISSKIFEISIYLTGGAAFLAIPVNGSWVNKYASPISNSPYSGGAFGLNAQYDFRGPAISGNYTVRFNFHTGQFTVTAI